MSNHRISRRRFLQDSTLVLAGVLLPSGLSVAEAPRVKHVRRVAAGPIVVDHTVVDRYVDIPQTYIDEVKKMWLNVPGGSHSRGYRYGLQFLEDLDPTYAVNVTETGEPEGPTDQHLRVSAAVRNQYNKWSWGAGEKTWYTWLAWNPSDPGYPTDEANKLKNHLTYANTNGLEIAALGFGWCWDMTSSNSPTGTIDSVFQVRWAGSSVGGPDGNKAWGLDDGDNALVGNRVNMDTYIGATQTYIDHCAANGYDTKVFFTTGPVEGGWTPEGSGEENRYQRYLKHEYIRDHVLARSDAILFDYADILTWNDDGEQNTRSWTDYGGTAHAIPYIHSDNMLQLDGSPHVEDGDHIGERGALRLGKALWWMLARIAGWEPEGPSAPTGLTATPISFMQIDLAWTASVDPNTVDYVIYRDGVQIDTCSGTSYSDTGVGPGRQYTYTVASRDGAGQAGSTCDPASATTPQAPHNVYVPLVLK